MNVKFVTVSDKGQIAIPSDIRQEAGINKGDQLVMIEEGGKIMIERSSTVSKKVKDDFKDLLKISEVSLKKLWLDKANDVWDQYLG